jgi:hypothetical protein
VDATDAADARCEFIRPDGRRCRARPRTGRPYCFAHDPESQEARAAACRAGGQQRSRRAATLPDTEPDAELGTVADVCRFLGRIANGTAKGKIDARVANAVTYTLTSLANAIAKSDLEERLRRVEEQLAADKRSVA